MGMKKTLLIVEDNLILCDILKRWLQKANYGVLTAIDEPSARRKIKENDVALVLTDVRLPEGDGISLLEWSISQGLHIPFVVMTEYATIADAVHAVKLGAKDYLPKPVHEVQLMDLLRGLLGLPFFVPSKKSFMKRRSLEIRETDRIACRVAPLDCSVMILGPNGSGKESVAQLIQQHSGRRNKPFVAVNCGCIRGELAASEFFGHVQGAFSDAKKNTTGYFEAARGGTLFLDEIGNMPPEMQTLLLRVLQESTTVSPSLKYTSPLSPNAQKIYCHWLISSVNNIQKRCMWKPPVLPNKPKSPCFLIHGRAMYVNLETG